MATEEFVPKALPTRLAAFIASIVALTLGVSTLAYAAGLSISGGASMAVNYWNALPEDLPLNVALPQHTVLLDKNGNEFARFYSENRIDVRPENISPNFTDALLATEDARFYDHGPIDLQGTLRAAIHNTSGTEVQGASTITQQLVQNILLNSARDQTEKSVAVGTTYGDKLRELKYAVGLEKSLTKPEILNTYSNTVFFGNSAYGVEAAARIYFNRTAATITRAQGALLVGLLRGPAVYDPFTHPEAAKNRRDTVLGRLAATGKISPDELTAAEAEPLGINRGTLASGCAKSKYPFYCSLVRKEILTDPAFGATSEAREDRLTRGGMILKTALDPAAMDAAQAAVTDALGNTNRAALGTAVIKPGTGQIIAIAQNRDWGSADGQTQIIYADSQFQVGSSMKPITLATALEQGIPVTTRLNADSPYRPATLDSPEGGFINYGNISYGTVDARQAIKMSLNTYFIRLIERTGVLPVADMAARLGITSLPRTGANAIKGQEASLTLGAYEISPIEMANAYAVFIGGGIECKPSTIISGTRADSGAPIQTPNPDCHQAIAPAVANTVADTLRQPLTAGGTLGELGGLDGREAGAKTGTTNDFAANWIVGFTPQYSTAVWLGDPRGGTQHPLDSVQAFGREYRNLTGSEVAAPVWKTIMNRISAGLPAVPLPKSDDAASSAVTAKAVPDLRGMSTKEAMTLLVQNDLIPALVPATAAPNSLYGADVVVAQAPAPGSSFGYKQVVNLTLSDGSNTTLSTPEKR